MFQLWSVFQSKVFVCKIVLLVFHNSLSYILFCKKKYGAQM